MSIEEALEFFEASPQIARILQTLADVGLGYMALGQSSTTLSGGEAQRIKLASELWRADEGHSKRMLERSVVILDEPSTGLAATDVEHLARCLGRLARQGDAVLVIEHHTELLEICDRLVELGPEGGAEGGQLIAEGTPAELAANAKSVTGPWLFRAPGAMPQVTEKPKRVPAGKSTAKKPSDKKAKGNATKKKTARKEPARARATSASGTNRAGHRGKESAQEQSEG